MKKLFLFLFAAFISTVVVAQGETEKQELRLSLQEARQYAIDNNRTLMNADIAVRQAHATRWQTIAQMLPQLDAKVNYQNMCGYSMDLGPMSIQMNPTLDLALTASVAVNGQLIVGTLLNNLAIEMQDINKRQSELDLVTSVEQLYMSALVMGKTVDLLERTYTNLDNLYKTTLGAVAVGAAEQTSADQIQVQVANMRSTINSTKRSMEVLYNSLALQLACGVDQKIVLTDNIDDLLNTEAALALLKNEFDITQNYQYQLLQKNTEISEKNVLMAGMAYVPTVSAFYQYSAKKYFGDAGMNMTPPNMVGVTVAVPIWSSGKRAAAVTEKKLALQAARNSQADAEDGLRLQDKQLRYNLSSAYEDFDIQRMNIDVSQRVFQSTSNKYEHGHASSLELTDASTSLLTAQSNYIQSFLALVNAQLELKKLLNK